MRSGAAHSQRGRQEDGKHEKFTQTQKCKFSISNKEGFEDGGVSVGRRKGEGRERGDESEKKSQGGRGENGGGRHNW